MNLFDIWGDLWNGFNNNPDNTATFDTMANMLPPLAAYRGGKVLAKDVPKLSKDGKYGQAALAGAGGLLDVASLALPLMQAGRMASSALPKNVPLKQAGMFIGEKAKTLNAKGQPIPPTQYELAHAEAQRVAALPVEQGGLGLPVNNTPMDRALAMGGVPAYHGTASDVQQIDPKMFGSSTGAQSAKRAWWAVDEPSTARGYAEYSANQAPVKRLLDEADRLEKKGDFDGYDAMLGKAEQLDADFAKNPLNGQNIMPLMILPKNPKTMNAMGAEFTDVEGGVNNFLRQAKYGGNDVAVIENLADDVGFNGRPATHYGVLNPSSVRSRFAAFNPAKRDSADLLASYLMPAATTGLLGYGLLDQDAYAR